MLQPGKIIFYWILFLDSGALIYLMLSFHLNLQDKIRFGLFFLQHLYAFFLFILKTHQNVDSQEQIVLAIFQLGAGNFIMFSVLEIYVGTQSESIIFLQQNYSYDDQFVVQIYLFFYYQINVYFGVIFFISTLALILFKAKEQNHALKRKKILEILQNQPYQGTGNQESCSICLNSFQVMQQLYKLKCQHIFHKQCFKNWLKYKISCPLCRDTDLVIDQ